MRLDKLITSQGLGSRKDAKLLVRQKQVLCNGQLVKTADCHIDPERDVITISGNPVTYKAHVYIMMNKPKGVICATDDNRHTTVLDLLPSHLRRPGLFPAGRLDIDTTGFVLITDDGAFAHNMLSPKKRVTKRYDAVISDTIRPEHIDAFATGVIIDGGIQCLPATLEVIENGVPSRVEIEIMEGKFHQIKRMFAAVGLTVLELNRNKIGGVFLDKTIKIGSCREMLHKEVEAILC